MTYRILIVDDEEPAREELAYMLSKQKEVDIVIQAATGMEALRRVKEHSPDLVFLDIDLPDLKGLQVAQILAELDSTSKIVFVTAYDQYAVEAFKLRAFHYILKPYDDDDLNLVFSQLDKEPKPVPSTFGCSSKLAVEMDGAIKYLVPKDIIFISKNKEDKSVSIFTTSGMYEANYTLQELEKKLTIHSFFRVHKSFLVNLDFVLELQPFYHSTYNLHLNDPTRTIVPVSRNYVKELRKRLEL
ncbi:MAG TPA: LytTR family DNA-binding domain-containing protein [Bacillota bacterium]|nr:LytTR family DNA-binding domain-containing protein [Bacillota bacterium]